jgi:hypothetical protein
MRLYPKRCITAHGIPGCPVGRAVFETGTASRRTEVFIQIRQSSVTIWIPALSFIHKYPESPRILHETCSLPLNRNRIVVPAGGNDVGMNCGRTCRVDCPRDNRAGFLEASDCDFGPQAQPFCQPGLKRSGGPGECCMRSFMKGGFPRPHQVDLILERLVSVDPKPRTNLWNQQKSATTMKYAGCNRHVAASTVSTDR